MWLIPNLFIATIKKNLITLGDTDESLNLFNADGRVDRPQLTFS